MPPDTSTAMIAAVMPGRPLVQPVTVDDQPEAERRAVELAVPHAPPQEPLHLWVDGRNAWLTLTGGDPGTWVLRHTTLAAHIRTLAGTRGITCTSSTSPVT